MLEAARPLPSCESEHREEREEQEGAQDDSDDAAHDRKERRRGVRDCLLYTSDAADERSSVDLGGRRILKKTNKKKKKNTEVALIQNLTRRVL